MGKDHRRSGQCGKSSPASSSHSQNKRRLTPQRTQTTRSFTALRNATTPGSSFALHVLNESTNYSTTQPALRRRLRCRRAPTRTTGVATTGTKKSTKATRKNTKSTKALSHFIVCAFCVLLCASCDLIERPKIVVNWVVASIYPASPAQCDTRAASFAASRPSGLHRGRSGIWSRCLCAARP